MNTKEELRDIIYAGGGLPEVTVKKIEALIDQRESALLSRVREEVIGEDVVTDPNPEIPEGTNETYDIQCYYRLGANTLRATQRTKLDQLSKEVEWVN